jgi:hypothetical protein
MACGRQVKGSHVNDDAIPCGTRLYYGLEIRLRTTAIVLCARCQAADAAEEAATKPENRA